MSRRAPEPPVITAAGDPEFDLWCGVCLAPWRVRVPLAVNGVTAGGIEFCPGCGTGHDKPGVYVTSEPVSEPEVRSSGLAEAWTSLLAPPPGRPRNPGCAYRDCPWPGRRRWQHQMQGDEGTWTYSFCRRRHRRKWAAANGVIL